MISTGIPKVCQHCGTPIYGPALHVGLRAYHPECTRAPGFQTIPEWPQQACPDPHSAIPMDDERVRQIVREELLRLGLSRLPQHPIPADMAKVLTANLWDLYASDDDSKTPNIERRNRGN